MKNKSLSLLASLLLAFAVNTFAQDSSEPSEDDSDWASAESQTQSANASDAQYEGSTDSEFADDEEYASAYARYKNEQTSRSEINKQRNEGFARTVILGIRLQGGINKFLLGNDDEDWGLGFQGGGGFMVRMNLPIKNLSIAPELTFNYRRYNFESDAASFGTYKGHINIMMFEIPIMVRYTFEDYDMFLGLGLNCGLKLTGDAELELDNDGQKSKTSNPITTNSVEVGAALDVGYILTRWIHLNLRVVQSFTNLRNETLEGSTVFNDAVLRTFYTTAGIAFLF
ncbi:MAG: PorT family protein [Fibrobacteraceae bacterium]|nr:PorT family protein [Fibrobacteraceae bacterium]